jgi:hypothetical protein
MTYYESAEGVTITRKRAIEEIKNHGLLDNLDDFDQDVGVFEEYEAQAVLQWLGY